VSLFLRETIAAGVGVKRGRLSIASLGELAVEMRYCDIQSNIDSFFESLIPCRRFGDFQTLASLPRPRPLELHVEPHIFYGHFRAWLRKRKLDPDQGDLHAYENESRGCGEEPRFNRDSMRPWFAQNSPRTILSSASAVNDGP
jgi:hypothetical protein